jgi:hypothetical protein
MDHRGVIPIDYFHGNGKGVTDFMVDDPSADPSMDQRLKGPPIRTVILDECGGALRH